MNKHDRKYIVYKITNTINNKIYIGQTAYSAEHRWERHKSCARNGVKHRFCHAIRKYGESCWDITVLCTTDNYEDICEKEKHYIKEFSSNINKFGYNATNGGTGGWMIDRMSPEAQAEWYRKQKEKSYGYGNSNWSGLTDEDMIEIGLEFVKTYGFICGLLTMNYYARVIHNKEFPKAFSKNRFGSKYGNFAKILEEKTGLVYNPFHKNRKLVIRELRKLNDNKN